MTILGRIKSYASTAIGWAWDNKPFIVAGLIGAEAFMNAAGMPIPPWLVGVDAALGVGALHSSVKASPPSPLPWPSAPSPTFRRGKANDS